jgi:cell division septum initiation protein DivIVA
MPPKASVVNPKLLRARSAKAIADGVEAQPWQVRAQPAQSKPKPLEPNIDQPWLKEDPRLNPDLDPDSADDDNHDEASTSVCSSAPSEASVMGARRRATSLSSMLKRRSRTPPTSSTGESATDVTLGHKVEQLQAQLGEAQQKVGRMEECNAELMLELKRLRADNDALSAENDQLVARCDTQGGMLRADKIRSMAARWRDAGRARRMLRLQEVARQAWQAEKEREHLTLRHALGLSK